MLHSSSTGGVRSSWANDTTVGKNIDTERAARAMIERMTTASDISASPDLSLSASESESDTCGYGEPPIPWIGKRH